MQIAPIADNGFRGPAKLAEYGSPVAWSPGELPDGRYDRFVLIDDDGGEKIIPISPSPVVVHSGVTTLQLTAFSGRK